MEAELYLIRLLHVISGIMWIGILWYFNFVQIPSMPKIPDEQKPAIGKVIAPEALFWFRWGAWTGICIWYQLYLDGIYMRSRLLVNFFYYCKAH